VQEQRMPEDVRGRPLARAGAAPLPCALFFVLSFRRSVVLGRGSAEARRRGGSKQACLFHPGAPVFHEGYKSAPPPPLPPPSRTNWTRLVPPSVLTGHVSSLLPYQGLQVRAPARAQPLRNWHPAHGIPPQRMPHPASDTNRHPIRDVAGTGRAAKRRRRLSSLSSSPSRGAPTAPVPSSTTPSSGAAPPSTCFVLCFLHGVFVR
jgi:hypothetical protein